METNTFHRGAKGLKTIGFEKITMRTPSGQCICTCTITPCSPLHSVGKPYGAIIGMVKIHSVDGPFDPCTFGPLDPERFSNRLHSLKICCLRSFCRHGVIWEPTLSATDFGSRTPLIALVWGGGPEDTSTDVFGVGDLQTGNLQSRATDFGSSHPLIVPLIALVGGGSPKDTDIDVFRVGDLQSANLQSRATGSGYRSPLIALVGGGGPEHANINVFRVQDPQSGNLQSRAADFESRNPVLALLRGGGPKDTNINVFGVGDLSRSTLIALVRTGGPEETNIDVFGVVDLQSGNLQSRATDSGDRNPLIAWVGGGDPEDTDIHVSGVGDLPLRNLQSRATVHKLRTQIATYRTQIALVREDLRTLISTYLSLGTYRLGTYSLWPSISDLAAHPLRWLGAEVPKILPYLGLETYSMGTYNLGPPSLDLTSYSVRW